MTLSLLRCSSTMHVKNLVEFFDPPSNVNVNTLRRPSTPRETLQPVQGSSGLGPSAPRSSNTRGRANTSSSPVTNPIFPRQIDERADTSGGVKSFTAHTSFMKLRGDKPPMHQDAHIPLLPLPTSSNPPGQPRSDRPSVATLIPSDHTPVPATVVFSRRAAPLYLPKLDKYLSSIPPPEFRDIPQSQSMFSPMDKLAKAGKSLDNLETNTRPYTWRNRNTVLGAIVSMVLGITVSLDVYQSFTF